MTGGARFWGRGVTAASSRRLTVLQWERTRRLGQNGTGPLSTSFSPFHHSTLLCLSFSPCSMATASPDDGGGVDAAGGGVDGGCTGGLLPGGESIEVEEVCGSSNPPKWRAPAPSLEYRAAGAFARAVHATPTGSHQWASAFGGVE